MMTSRERVARTLVRQPADRVPITDWFWKETEQEFVQQLNDPRLAAGINSAGPDNYDLLTLWDYFEMDFMQVAWPDQRLRLVPPTVVEETDEWILQRDGNDALLRWWKNKGGTPEHISFGIDTPEKWARVKPLLTASRERIRWPEFWPRYRRGQEHDRFIFYAGVEIIESVKDVLGHEMMLRAMIKQPEWVHDVFATYAQFEIDMFRLAEAEGMVCDGAFIYADIAYKNGPFMSPRHYREFVQPYHRRFLEEFHRRGMPVVLHSDGDIRPLLPAFLENGVAAINPLEARAGMDLRELAPQYGERLGFVGNIDVTVLATNDRDRIGAELRAKLDAAMPYHGYIYHSDHSIPPGVTLETYQWLLSEVRRLGRYD